MATGLGSGTANSILNELCNAGTWTVPTAFWVKLHTGDPGAAGTANAASNTTRMSATFGSAAAGSITTTADITWTSVSATESYSHVSFWDSDSGGTLIATDNLETTRGLTGGDNFTISAGDLDISLSAIAS
jgi:hypothetical protein